MRKNILYPLASIAVLLLAWELAVFFFNIPGYIFPSLYKVIATFFQQLPVLLGHGLHTFAEAGIGLGLAAVLAFILGILMDVAPAVKKSLYPILVVTQTVPVIVLTPIFLIYFGFGMTPKVITVVLMCFFPIAISFSDALASVEQEYLSLFLLYRASKLQTYRYLKVPASVDAFFSGMKVAATYSVSGAVVGEWISSDKGLGYYMLRVKNSGSLDKVFASVLLVILLSLGMNGIVKLVHLLVSRKNGGYTLELEE